LDRTKDWRQYQIGIGHKNSLELYKTVDKNERFYTKRHWEGVRTNGLPAAVLPYAKRIVDFKVAMVTSDRVSMTFTPQGVSDDANDELSLLQRKIASQLTDYARTVAENTKFDEMNSNGLLDAAISGDMVSFWFWDESIDAGNGIMGDINGHLVDNVNVFLGDVNTPEINNVYGPVQPYIIIAFRKNVKEVRDEFRREAEKRGMSEDEIEAEIENITPDNETGNQAGDRAKIELNEDEESGKCIVLLKMWREYRDGKWHIMARRSTEYVVIRDTWDTGLHRYPVAWMNWDIRKGSCHGEAEITSLIQNQVIIDKLASMIALWIYRHGFTRMIYDKSRITSISNDITQAIAVNDAASAGGVGSVAQYMQPAQLSAAVQSFFTMFITLTKEAAGANESILGEAAPTNTSAIIVNSKNAAVPLNNIKQRFYRYIEDVGLIWLDFWMSKYTQYTDRQIEVTKDGVKQVITLDTETLKQMRLKLRIDVSPSSPFDEAAQQQTLDNLLAQDRITFVEWLERVKKGIIPDKEGLIEARTGEEARRRAENEQFMWEIMAKEMREIEPTLPDEARNQLKMLQRNDPMAYEEQAKALMREHIRQPRPYAMNVEGGGGA
jgi:hypothetical protein